MRDKSMQMHVPSVNGFDASRSNSIYGASTTVMPSSVNIPVVSCHLGAQVKDYGLPDVLGHILRTGRGQAVRPPCR